jgi:hypothetical protein
VEFGIHIGTPGCVVTRENIIKVAIDAEVNGYGILGVADHLIVPVKAGVQAASSDLGGRRKRPLIAASGAQWRCLEPGIEQRQRAVE